MILLLPKNPLSSDKSYELQYSKSAMKYCLPRGSLPVTLIPPSPSSSSSSSAIANPLWWSRRHRNGTGSVPQHRCTWIGQRRTSSSSSSSTATGPEHDPGQAPLDVAVIGGGITGLAAAYSLCQVAAQGHHRKIAVTLYESGPRLGGWMNSKTVHVGRGHGNGNDNGDGDGTIVFEQGPRSLRPGTLNGLLTRQLVGKWH